MPELPEVETVRLELNNKIVGRKINKVIVNHLKIIQKFSQAEFARELKGKTIKKVLRRGKYIIIDLFPKSQLIVHLGMTGILIYPYRNNSFEINKNLIKPKHNHIIFSFNDSTRLVFNDVRKFGKVYLVNSIMEIDSIAKLGVEPLSDKFTKELFFKLLKMHQKKRIKSLIMNQKLIVGLGNIYANEALYRTHVHPMRLASSLNYYETFILHKQIQLVLRKAIQLKGSTISDGAFRDTDGKKGEFEQEIQIYGRRGKACVKCQHTIEMVRIEGRSSFYCPICQKL